MSEDMTDRPSFSRPALQRTEFGPMLHEFTHNAYDAVEELALENIDIIAVPQTMEELTTYGGQLQYILNKVVWTQKDDPAWADMINFLETYQPDPIFPLGNGITSIDPSAAVSEGLASGIHVPINFYQLVDGCERWYGGHKLVYSGLPHTSDHPIEAAQFVDRIISPSFLGMLGQLAYAPNGYLGSTSTDSSRVNGGRTFGCFNKIMYADPDWSEFFDVTDGVVTGFAEAFLQKKQQRIYRINQDPDKYRVHTGGCPVRHNTFKALGEHAKDYIAGERPLNEGTSAITRGAQLVSNVLKAKLATL